MPSQTPTPEFVTVPRPPEAKPSLRRRGAVLLRDAVCGSLLVGAVVTVSAAVLPAGPVRTPCFPAPPTSAEVAAARAHARVVVTVFAAVMSEAEVRARLREIATLRQAEAEIRATLPRSRPGLYIPPNLEEYR